MKKLKPQLSLSISFFTVTFAIILFISSCKKPDFAPVTNAGISADDNAMLKERMKDKRPNIILIMADDVGYEIPTCNGGQSYYTPTLDAMADGGMRFTQCYSTPLCAPSRFEIMTGKYNFRNYTFYGSLGQDQHTFANVLQNKGYATCMTGKWALDGGDTSIHIFGFDNYSIWNAYKETTSDIGKGRHYKNPKVFQNGEYLPESYTDGKYGDDVFAEYLNSFIDSNKRRPFFAYFTPTLLKTPFSPTPDNPLFATWDPENKISDPKYFPEMVTYLDKLIGNLLKKLDAVGLKQKTVVILALGDNGTSEEITSKFNGQFITGGRSQTTIYGTHVPLIVYWPGTVNKGKVINDLVDFSDFMPTIADIAGTNIPASYGTIDGVSFYPQLMGEKGNPREWIFCHYQPFINVAGNEKIYRWVQNADYKLYDSTGWEKSKEFFNLNIEPTERKPLKDDALSNKEKNLKEKWKQIFLTMHN